MNEQKSEDKIKQDENKYNEGGSQLDCIEFKYCADELEFSKIEWPNDGISFMKSKFDKLLSKKWDKALANGCFWYTLDEVKTRKIDGKIGFIAQLNTKRFNSRRKPADIHTVKEPFQSEKFNFTKVKKSEVLLKINPKSDQSSTDAEGKENHLIINVSPIDYGHVLLVPNVNSCISQRLNYDALKMSIELCLLSTHRGLRIGFNSLCAFASVNHLHFHVLYVNFQLPIDSVDVSPIGHGIFELYNYPVRGFALQLENHDISQLARRAEEITSYLYENDIAHNLFMCRHESFNSNTSSTNESTVRVFIFPKLSAPAMTENPFNAATLEIAGYLPVRDEQEFEELNENETITILNRFCLRDDEFDEIKNKIVLVFHNLHL